jgi:two-component system sensor histidine kinase DesK
MMLAAVLLFMCIYIWATLQNARALVTIEPGSITNPTWLSITLLILLGLVLIFSGMGRGYGNSWFATFIYTSAYIAGRLRPRRALPVIVGLTALTVVSGIVVQVSEFEVGQSTVFVFVVGIVTMSVMRAVSTERKLRAAQEEIARLAVTNERLRIARDLHDLLGHNLSLITLKSELAGRLLPVAPERAVNEIRDIESMARTTLQEVREAVSAYRQPTLASELQAAQEILAAAHIAYRFDGGTALATSLPERVDAVLAWTVREGVTNVIKHSRAQHCTIRLTKEKASFAVEILDDGTTFDVRTVHDGNGLRGLQERVAALDGRYEAVPCSTGGFRLAAILPLAQKHQRIEKTLENVERGERL